VAKGADEVAARIRERAEAAGVPLHPDPPTARALFAAVPLGAEIRPEHYRAVAAAILFAEEMRARRRAQAPASSSSGSLSGSAGSAGTA
jgi:flagellar biosynthetic protein FlhB